MTTSATSVAAAAPGFFAALDALRLVLERLGAERDLERLYAATVLEAAGFFEVEQCALFLRDELSGGWKGVRPAAGLTEAQLQALDAIPASVTAELLARRPEPGVVRVQDPAYKPPADQEAACLLNEHDALLAQLCGEGSPFGLLWLANRRDGAPFSAADEQFLGFFAGQVSILIQNLRLLGQEQRARELTAALDELKELDRMKDEFVQTVSHELRTPLTFIKGYVELLLDGDLGDLSDEQTDALRIVMERTENITHLVNDIISLTRPDSAQLALESVDLTSLARAAIQSAGAVTDQVRLRLELDAEGDLPRVRGDLQRLSQVFDNLLGNALKFSPEGGLISVRLRRQDSVVRTEVSDQGIGIPADRIDRIWDRFYQVDGTTTRRFGGTGLGLAIVKRLIEAHGGEVGVSSVEGQGSTFYFTVPVDEARKE